jgi:hypothetical protein
MKVVLILSGLLLLAGCSTTVPKEVVELSYQMEKDLVQVQAGYISLAKQHVAVLKQQREDYLRHEWIPLFVKGWITDGKLIELADGSLVYDESVDDYRAPRQDESELQLDNIVEWSAIALEMIDDKRQALMAPLDKAEKELTEDINRSFASLLLGNQTISAHLNSIRKVQEVQNELLKKAEWGGLRNRLNEKLSKLSGEAREGLDQIRKLDKQASEQTEKLK